jgi:hypothetical protein
MRPNPYAISNQRLYAPRHSNGASRAGDHDDLFGVVDEDADRERQPAERHEQGQALRQAPDSHVSKGSATEPARSPAIMRI